jgi:hypothetical protein
MAGEACAMTEILVKFDEPITGPRGDRYFAQALGRERDDGLWEGWLEFIPVDEAGAPIPSGRETTQPNLTDVKYWAQGLTRVYLQGALTRAVLPTQAIERDRAERERF